MTNEETRIKPLVLIGTPETLRVLEAQFRAAGCEDAVASTVRAGDTRPAAGGARVLDDLAGLHRNHRFAMAVVSLPEAMAELRSRVSALCRTLDLPERRVPVLADSLSGVADAPVGAPRALDFQALIGRPTRPIDREAVARFIGGRRVLITGAGGSIGSELAMRCAEFGPSLLALMERSENALFDVDRRIAAMHSGVLRRSALHDVVDAPSTLRRVQEIRPDIVFHAAAHKHVPMMEDHPAAAVSNNFFGTKSIADASLAVGVRRFVMISTDKAVNPSSVMGATKRLAELYVQGLNRDSADGSAPFCLVRFGNVLGSACSVLPIWSAQIAEGGPVTVTHPAMTRYFMSIAEAAALVIQAGAQSESELTGAARSGVFVLDMGEPVRIADLAERFVRAHGLAPAWDDPLGIARAFIRERAGARTAGTPITVRFTGPRPGEKMHEELAYDAEELAPTEAPGVLAWAGHVPDETLTKELVESLQEVRYLEDRARVLAAIRGLIPEMGHLKADRESWSVAAA